MGRPLPSQADLVKKFEYVAETGKLLWKNAGHRTDLVGKQAGWLTDEGYREVGVLGKTYFVHILIWVYVTGRPPEGQIDHEDQVRDNNAWYNLRDVTPSQNQRNATLGVNNTSGHVNVSSYISTTKGERFVVRFRDKGNVGVGTFDTKEEAVSAYEKAKLKHGFHPNHGKSKVL